MLAEPALTNIGIVLPEPGFHDALRAATREHRHAARSSTRRTRSAPGRAAARGRTGLEPDLLTIGKPIGGGMPCAAYGLTRRGRRRGSSARSAATSPTSAAIGGTLAGNALSLAAMRATLAEVLTDEAFARMIPLGERFEAGVAGRDRREHALPWHVTRLGCRAEYWFRPQRAAERRRGRGRRRRRSSTGSCTSGRSTAASC